MTLSRSNLLINMSFEKQPFRPERPVGVSVLTIWDGIALGVLPVLREGIAIATTSSDGDFSIVFLCSAIGLPIAIVSAAIGTFKGNDRARLGLLILLAIYFILNIFQNTILRIAGNLTPEEQVTNLGRILVSIVSLFINLWYFLRPSTIAYFRRPIETQQNREQG